MGEKQNRPFQLSFNASLKIDFPVNRNLKIDLQRSVERELEWLILFLSHWVLTSGKS